MTRSISAIILANDAGAPPWDARAPREIFDALKRSDGDAIARERRLTALLERHEDAPELWWELALAQVAQNDELNADICHERFTQALQNLAAVARSCARNGAARLAFDIFARLEPAFVRLGAPQKSTEALISQAGAALGCGQLAPAWSSVAKAYKCARRQWPRDWGLYAEAVAAAGVISHASHDYRRSRARLRLSVVFAAHAPERPYLRARLLRDLGACLSDLRFDSEAESVLRDACEAALDADEPRLLAWIQSELADHLVQRRRFKEAMALFELALQCEDAPLQEAADIRLKTARCTLHLARTLDDGDLYRQAREHSVEAARLRLMSGNWRAASEEFLLHAHIDLLCGRFDNSQALLVSTLRIIRQSDAAGSRLDDIAHGVAAGLRSAQGRLVAADFWAARGLARATQNDSPSALNAYMTAAAVAHRRGDLGAARAHLGEVISREAQALERISGREHGPGDWARLRLANEATEVLAALDLEAAASDPSYFDKVAATLLFRRGVARDARLKARFGAGDLGSGRDLEALRMRLAPGEALAAIFQLRSETIFDPDRSWVIGFGPPRAIFICLKANAPVFVTDLGDYNEARAQAAGWRRAMQTEREAPAPPLLSQLSETLNCQRLYWMGENEFEILPWRALLPATEIVQIPSLTPGHAREGERGNVLCIVAPEFAPGGRPAPHVQLELDAATGAREASMLLHSAATPAAVIEALQAPWARVHIIAHGAVASSGAEVAADAYDGAYIELAGGILRAGAMAQLDLRQVELAILSSCSSAAGLDQIGEGAASMAGALLDAGAQAVVAALWPVPDVETAMLMSCFYRALDGRSPAPALVEAQNALRVAGERAQAWAGWTLFGRLREAPIT